MLPLRGNRDFMLLWGGEAVSALGWRVANVAFPLLVLAETGSPARAGLVGFLGLLPWLVFSLPAGALVDRWHRRRVMIVAYLGGFVAIASVPAAIWLDFVSLPFLGAVAFVDGAFFVFFRLAETGAIRAVVPSGQLPDAVAQNEAREYAASLAGPPLGGILFGIDRALPFILDAVSYLVAFVFLLGVRGELQERRERPSRSLGAEIHEGLVWLWERPFMRVSLALVAGSNLVAAALALVLIVDARDQGASPALVGVMLGTGAAGGLLGALAAPRLRRVIPGRAIVVGFPWLGAAVLSLLAVAPHPLLLGLLYAVWLFFGPVWNAIVDGYRISVVPDELQGRVEGVASLVSFAVLPLGPLAAGFALETVGPDATLLVFGAWLLALGLAGTVSSALRELDAIRA